MDLLSKKKSRLFAVTVASFGLAFAATPQAFASEAAIAPPAIDAATSADNDPAKIASQNQWLESKGYSSADKSSVNATAPKSPGSGASTQTIKFQNGRMSAQKFTNISAYSCCTGDIAAGFVSNVKFGGGGIGATVNGDSYASWLGSKPSNPTKTTLVSDISRAGVGGASVGSGGGTVQINGSHVLISSSSKKSWRTTQAYSNVKFSGPIISVSQEVSGQFVFGAASFRVSAK